MKLEEKYFSKPSKPPKLKTYLDYIKESDYKESRKKWVISLWKSEEWRVNNAIYKEKYERKYY